MKPIASKFKFILAMLVTIVGTVRAASLDTGLNCDGCHADWYICPGGWHIIHNEPNCYICCQNAE